MVQNLSPYMAYMLRIWLENGDSPDQSTFALGTWRASLEDPHTKEMRFFADLEALFDFLSSETELWASGEKARPSRTPD